MPAGKQSRGKCAYCGTEAAKGGMTRHLAACPKRQEAIQAVEGGKSNPENIYHLRVQDAGGGDFWLDLEMAGSETLDDLDHYLRRIWLECCGHLSQFSIGGWRGDEIPMSQKIGHVFKPGVELTHIYDFGTSSFTLVKLVDTRKGKPVTKHPVALMARNLMPEVQCKECGQPATKLCLECVHDHNTWGFLCDKHAKKHPHEDYGEPIDLVNSPRLGMCGYDGPAEPPY